MRWASVEHGAAAVSGIGGAIPAGRYAQHDDRPVEDHILVLHDATWADYQRLLEIRGEHSAPRISYLKGSIEIMTPSTSHEAIKGLVGCLLEVWCLERNVEFSTLGSWTVERKELERAVEPDECYVFGEHEGRTEPDLAIEVVWTSGGINKLAIYSALGVREVWSWRRGRLTPWVLRDGAYVEAASSEVLPQLDLAQLTSFLDGPTTSAAMRAYRSALTSGIAE